MCVLRDFSDSIQRSSYPFTAVHTLSLDSTHALNCTYLWREIGGGGHSCLKNLLKMKCRCVIAVPERSYRLSVRLIQGD